MANQRISAPVIEGGSLNINNRFKVDNSGNVSISESDSRRGLSLNNQRIALYDDNGVEVIYIGRY